MFRVWHLSITVAVLQSSVLKADAETLVLDYFDKPRNLAIFHKRSLHEVINATATQNWTYMVLGLILVALAVMIAKKVFKRVRGENFPRVNLSFMLEFISSEKTKSTFISVCNLNGVASDYSVSATEFIKGIEVVGFFIPALHFSWESLGIRNILTNQIIHPPNFSKLSWLEAWILRRVLRKPFVLMPIFSQNNRLIRIQLQRTSDRGEQIENGNK